MDGKIDVLIADDSALMRKMLEDILSADPRINVIGKARDGEECLEKVRQLLPDVLTLDVEMPKKNGLQVLEELMRTRPMPVIMVSSLTKEGAQTTLKALSLGCVDFVAKPSGAISVDIQTVGAELISKVVAAKGARVSGLNAPSRGPSYVGVPLLRPGGMFRKREIIAIASSTGGPMALQQLLSNLPGTLPVPIVITQHMPKDFTGSFAKRLDSVSKLVVLEAEEGVDLKPGHVYIAPGGSHLLVKRRNGKPYCTLSDAPPVLSVKPSANIMFLSVMDEFNGNAVAVILTGMGRDGADGAVGLHSKGAYVIAESQETCVVYGMPKAAVEAGVVDELLPLPDIPGALLRSVKG